MIPLLRTEFVKGVRRRRTLVIVLALAALPTVITLAIHARGVRPDRGGGAGEGLFRLARQSGLVVPAAVLAIMSGFLLVIIAAMFAGDTVAGDASSGNLRYLLLRPVSRAKLLMAKAAVAGALIWATTIIAAVAALIAGIAVFGAHPLAVPATVTNGPLGVSAFTLSTGTLLGRLTAGTAYVAFGFTALLALGTFFSTLTDTPAGAIGGAVGVYIISEILDGITEFGTVRYGFPTHYLDAWQTMITQNKFSQDMVAGIIVQLGYLVVFGAAALWWFSRKDISS
jgi:ABC-2 type transport system permease protein